MTRAAAPRRASVAAELRQVISRLRRAIRNRARSGSGVVPLPLTQLEVVRLLWKEPGMRVLDVAQRLGIASNTASTLVSQLSAARLVERRRDAEDARVARLYLSEVAKARIARMQDRGATAVARALERLKLSDRDLIARATPALARLLVELEAADEFKR